MARRFGQLRAGETKLYFGKLFDYDDIPYDEQAELLFDLATQAVTTLAAETTTMWLRTFYQNQSDAIAKLIHAQLNNHFFEEATEYVVDVRSGFSNAT